MPSVVSVDLIEIAVFGRVLAFGGTALLSLHVHHARDREWIVGQQETENAFRSLQAYSSPG